MSSANPVCEAVLGLDIGKTRIHAALLRGTQAPRQKAIANTAEGHQELLTWLSQHRVEQLHACLEATSTDGHELAKRLHQAGDGVTIANPKAVQAHAQSSFSRTKTDAVDARLIAESCRDLKPGLWQPPAPAVAVLQALMQRLQALEQMIGQETNRLETAPADLVSDLQTHIKFMEDQLQALRDKIQTHIDPFPDLKRQQDLLDSIPGIGPQTIALLLAEIGHWQHFDSARQLATEAGLTPQEKTAGTSIHGQPRLCKLGNARLRKALFLPALCLLRWNQPIQAGREQLLERHKHKRQVVGAVMHKLIGWVDGGLRSNQPFAPKICAQAAVT